MRTSCPPAKTVNESPGYAMKFSKQPELIFSVLTAFGVNFIGETILELRSILLRSVDKYSIDSNTLLSKLSQGAFLWGNLDQDQ